MHINPFLYIIFQLNTSISINCVIEYIQNIAPGLTVPSILKGFIKALTLPVPYFSKVTDLKVKFPTKWNLFWIEGIKKL